MRKRGIVAAAVASALLSGAAGIAAAGVTAGSADEPRRPDGSTPLQWAVFDGDLAEAQRLLKLGADPKATNNYGVNALLLAADIADTGLIQALLKAGADANSANADGETALHLMARSANVEAAKLLVKAGAKVDAREAFGEQTPLMWASARRQPQMMEFLISKGADINANGAARDYQRVATSESRAKSLDRGGLTPLMYAARENCRECVEVLLKHKVDVDQPDPSRVVPVSIAMLNGNWDIAKRLIESGADVNQWDWFGRSPLHVAIANIGNAGSRSPLDSDKPNQATARDVIKLLVERGADPNQQLYYGATFGSSADRGLTPFLAAVGTGDIDLVKLLLAHGANARLATADGRGAIIMAVSRAGGRGRGGFGPPGGAPPAGAAAGAPAGAPRGGAAPAGGARAARPANPTVELVNLLAQAGADVTLMSKRHFLARTRGGSALHYVVRNGGDPQVTQALLDLGLDINAKDEDGLTALDYAMGRGYVPFLQMPTPPNKTLADSLRKLGASVELDKTPDWPPQGPPIATAVYDSVVWPVDPVGP
ncbi:MAG TPA: ankyrin repeat domain-containing protein [Steroidobacteraceae bacterium]|nr:ankyrin repeat domain-containing protein [Steroidobacteraceae bacterium]